MIKENSNPTAKRIPTQLSSDDAAKWNIAPRTDWTGMTETEHFVQFYEADGFLLNSLGGFIGSAINSGDAALVVATEAHRDGLDDLLTANGLDVAYAKSRGQFVSIDAAETLSRFMVDGSPQLDRFNEVVGGIIATVSDGRPRVRAFGEMVALLWADGEYQAALRLEEMWNELQKVHTFSLFCAYPMNGLSGQQFMEPHSGVCTVHSRVIPAESYAGLDDQDARLRAIAKLQQKAASLQAEIEERQRAEEKLRLALVGEQIARAEAETANRIKDEFLATVSHELRTPLNAIMGWAHLLRGGRLDEASVARALETIDRNAKSQAQLIEDILDVSRIITGKLRLNREPVDIASVINAAIDSVQLAIDSKELQLEVTLDPSARHTVGDANRLQQIVWNLLANSIKFTPAGGRIAIRVKRAEGNLQLRVSDSGQGIGESFLPFIFDRFRQADGTITRQHGGLGLGLAIVRHLVELHGGSIAAESEGEGRGSTFTLTLGLAPRNGSRRRKITGALRAKEISHGHFTTIPTLDKVRVLVVDDDPDTLQFLSVMLGESKAIVETAASVSQAVDLLEWYRPHVVVSDLAMPNEDGFSLMAKIRALKSFNGNEIPAVAMTSYVRVEDRARALAAGFNMFVPKPIEPHELITAIASLAEAEVTR